MSELFKQLKLQPVFLDFEFRGTSEPKFDLICASLKVKDTNPVDEFWLFQDPKAQKELVSYIRELAAAGATFVSYGSVEQQSFLSMGISSQEVLSMKWIDLHLEWNQLRNKNNERMYGKYIKDNGEKAFSTPPCYDSGKLDDSVKNTVVPGAMVQACYNVLGEVIDTEHKKAMRDVCIHGTPDEVVYSQDLIQEYCTSDIIYLPRLLDAFLRELYGLFEGSYDYEATLQHMYTRGRTSTCTAIIGTTGIPVDVESIRNLQVNAVDVKNSLIEKYNTEVYPLWELRRVNLKSTETKLVESDRKFAEMVTHLGFQDTWPSTASGALSKDEETLKGYSEIPEVKKLVSLKNRLKQFRWVSGSGDRSMSHYIGGDSRIRPYLNPYGSQTGRWQPKATSYPFLMSRFYRSLLKCPEGYAFAGLDWVSQEFAIKAYLSNDLVMLEAYKSGDPYMFLPRYADFVPDDATKDTHPDVREAFKTITLGRQFGLSLTNMGVRIANKLFDGDIDAGNKLATRAFNAYSKAFCVSLAWDVENLKHYYDRFHGGSLTLSDGWTLWGDNPVKLSVQNFPVQGTGAVILREAIYRALKAGLKICAPLHDAIYLIFKLEEKEETITLAKECMNQAVKHVLGEQADIRIDVDIHPWNETWIEGRAVEEYEFLKPYLTQNKPVSELNYEKFLRAFNLTK